MAHGCKRAGGFVDSNCCEPCDCPVTQRLVGNETRRLPDPPLGVTLHRVVLEPGMRVRCVKPAPAFGLSLGDEYEIAYVVKNYGVEVVRLKTERGLGDHWSAIRFKPVVRVKMGRAVA